MIDRLMDGSMDSLIHSLIDFNGLSFCMM